MKKHVMMALLLGTAVLATGCSGKSSEDKASTEAQVATEAETKTESGDETETETEESELQEEDSEEVSEEISEEAAEVTEEELGERPEYQALDYVTLGTYKGLSVVLDPIKVTEEEIDTTIQSKVEFADLYDQKTEGAVQEGDIVNIDFEGKLDGVAFDGGTAEGYDLTIGSHSFIDGFEDGLIGVNVGDTVDLDLTFPENYGNEELAGQATVFTVTVNYIKTVPEITDELVEKLSEGEYKTVDGYRESVRDQLQTDKEDEQQNQIYSDLMAELYNTCTVNEYPQDLVDYSVASMTNTYKQWAQTYGMEFTEFIGSYFGMNEEQFASEVEASVKQSLQQELILKAIAEQEELELSEEEYKEGCERYVEQYGYESTEQLEEEAGRATLEMSILMDKVIAFVKENAVIEVKEPETETEETFESEEETAVEEAETESEEVAEAVAPAESETAAETETEAVTE